jgi:CheY-like chemotaxis protein
MGVVMGNLDLATLELPDGSGIGERIADARKASRRAAEISHLMLAYIGHSAGKSESINLSDLCRDALPALTDALPEGLRVKTEFQASGPIIQANAAQMRQVLSNLMTNAVEAIGCQEGEITLTIDAVPATHIRAAAAVRKEWKPSAESYACLSVADTGCGMDRETAEKIFDPFFSTKFTGRGLGLPVVEGVVKAHGGTVAMESRPGEGTVFRVFLPVTEQVLHPRQKMGAVVSGAQSATGTVLVVEDDTELRNMAKEMLKKLGYESMTAADGVEAVEVFRRNMEKIHCVLCDLTMPRMDGWETLEALRKLKPAISLILASGYDEARVMGSDHSESPQVFLHKPYTLADLKSALSSALGRPSTR